MSKKQNISENYLERCPVHPDYMDWSVDEAGMVTLHKENKGFFNRLAQFFFNKPRVSHIHLDDMGSFVWPRLTKGKTILMLGEEVKMQFGENAEPLYERLAKFFQVLDSYGFIAWDDKE